MLVVELDAPTLAFLAAAAVVAGAVNSVAGGGSLISFPALLAVGYPAVTANATNIVAVVPGYLSGSLAYRDELRGQAPRVWALAATTVAGALAGAALLLVLPADFFELIAPFLILAACAALAAAPLIERAGGDGRAAGAAHRSPALHLLLFAAALYGGYFGAALGLILLAVLELGLRDDLQRANALKTVLSLVAGLVAAGYLLAFGPVVLGAAAVMAAGSLAGGKLGVTVARRLAAPVLRAVVVAFGVAVAVVLLAT